MQNCSVGFSFSCTALEYGMWQAHPAPTHHIGCECIRVEVKVKGCGAHGLVRRVMQGGQVGVRQRLCTHPIQANALQSSAGQGRAGNHRQSEDTESAKADCASNGCLT